MYRRPPVVNYLNQIPMLNLTFITITFLAILFFYLGTGRDKRVLISGIIWVFITGMLAYSGFLQNTSAIPPRFLLVLAGAIGLSVYLYRVTKDKQLNRYALLAVHTLRLPVELVLYQLFLLKKVPVLMTFAGWNFDILVGISALLILVYLFITKKELPGMFVLIWNICGLLFLTTIVCIAILSAPLPVQQLAFDQPNIAVFTLPFIWLPAIVVPMVYLSHILALKNR
jgi:hypothetical protein